MTRSSKVSIGLSVLACIGVGVTAFLSVKRVPKYKELYSEAEYEKDQKLSDEEYDKMKEEQGLTEETIDDFKYLSKKEEAVIFAKAYWPAVVSGTITCGLIVGAQILDIREIMGLTAGLAAVTYKFNDIENYIHEKFPDQYEEVMKHVNGEAAKRAIEKSPKKKKETYDGRNRYYFPLSDQVVFMKPEDLIKVQGYISSVFGTRLEIHINEILDYIHQDLGYKDVHLCDMDYIWEFAEDDETLSVETYNFPNIELEYDDILDDDGQSIVCQVITLSLDPRKEAA